MFKKNPKVKHWAESLKGVVNREWIKGKVIKAERHALHVIL